MVRGYGTQGDCSDNNAAINSGATEIYEDNTDESYNEMSNDKCSLSVGDSCQGGIIAYMLQPGNPGYVASERCVLIAGLPGIRKNKKGCSFLEAAPSIS
jgi:hypothetical protein